MVDWRGSGGTLLEAAPPRVQGLRSSRQLHRAVVPLTEEGLIPTLLPDTADFTTLCLLTLCNVSEPSTTARTTPLHSQWIS